MPAGPRTLSIAIEHLVAEIIAFPIASEWALKHAVTELDGETKGPAKGLWREAEANFHQAFPSVSLDELVNLRDRLWFEATSPGRVLIPSYLMRIAGQTLRPMGQAPAPVDPFDPSKSEVNGRWFWKWLSFALPPDLILAAHEPPVLSRSRPAMVSRRLARSLEDYGYAQVHLHFGAGIDFPDLWTSAVIGAGTNRATALHSPGAQLDEGREFHGWILCAALTRLLLAAFLKGGRPEHSFESFLETSFAGGLRPFRREVTSVINALAAGSTSNLALKAVQTAYRTLARLRDFSANATLIQAQDPLVLAGAAAFPSSASISPECRLTAEGLQYCREEPRDALFRVCLVQCIRVRCLLYRHVVQRPLTPGLPWFIRHYARLSPIRSVWPDHVLLKCALSLDRPEGGLRSMEFRTAPSCDSQELHKLVAGVSKLLTEGSPGLEAGIVLHFAKSRGGGWEGTGANAGAPKAKWKDTNADPGFDKNGAGYRYQNYVNEQLQRARVVARFLLTYSNALSIIRGFDTCTDELGVPAWVMVPLFRLVRTAGIRASAANRAGAVSSFPPPRFTVHCGEDFVHLLGGLRRIEESLRYLELQEGDRLGHALALGVEPAAWAHRVGKVVLCREDRLLDLLWEWKMYTEQAGLSPSARRIVFVEKEILRLARLIFGDQPVMTLELLLGLVLDLHNPSRLRSAGFPNGSPRSRLPDQGLELLRRYLTGRDVFREAHELEAIDVSEEADTLISLQAALRKAVGCRGLAVEVNPSSNLLIGDLSDLKTHPVWRLARAGHREDEIPDLAVAIGSDDPITFATTIREEYQLMADVLVRSGLSDHEALEWVDARRRTGLECRFTVPPRPDTKPEPLRPSAFNDPLPDPFG